MIVIRQARILETDKPKSWETTFGSRAEAEKYIKMIRGEKSTIGISKSVDKVK